MCFGQAKDAEPANRVEEALSTGEALPSSSDQPLHPFVPAYGFDLQDIGRTFEEGVSVHASAMVQSKHMWHGFDLHGRPARFLPVASFSLADTGFSAKVIGVCDIGGTLSQRDELDAPCSTRGIFCRTPPVLPCAMLDYFYYSKPRIPSLKADTQEMGLGLAWPKLLGGLAPELSYYFGSLWPSEHGSFVSNVGGFIDVLGVTHHLALPNPGSEDHPQSLKLYGDLTYNDGFGVRVTAGPTSPWARART